MADTAPLSQYMSSLVARNPQNMRELLYKIVSHNTFSIRRHTTTKWNSTNHKFNMQGTYELTSLCPNRTQHYGLTHREKGHNSNPKSLGHKQSTQPSNWVCITFKPYLICLSLRLINEPPQWKGSHIQVQTKNK